MNTSAIREQLHQFTEQASERKLQGMYLLIADDAGENSSQQLSAKEIEMLDNDWQNHRSGATESYTWEEAKKMIRGL